MMRRFQRGIAVATALLLGTGAARCSTPPSNSASAVGGTAPAVTAPVEGMRVIATSQELMHAIVIPSSDVLFKIAGDQPKSDDDWQKVRVQALALAESANLLMMPGRGPDSAPWNQMAKGLMDTSLSAVKAADGKNVEALDMASNAIYESCDSCHNKYMKK